MIDFGKVDPDEARAKAEADTAHLFRHGRQTENVYLFAVEEEESEATVGMVFFASLRRATPQVAFIYGIEIDELFRGQGLGRAAMLAVEEKVRDLGHGEIRLNVFGGNEPARALYRSLGYEDVDVTMMKSLV